MIAAPPKPYFDNLDALRFFAWLSVFFQHSFGTTSPVVAAHPVYRAVIYVSKLGDLGVNFFFVLSGFLITYLLLDEEARTGNIGVIRFYVRRVLRIWPLYYACVLFGFLVLPAIKQRLGTPSTETADPFLFAVFMVNFDRLAHGPPPSMLGVLWSVSIEEQFYLAWPLLVRGLRRWRGALFGGIIAGSLVFRLAMVHQPQVLYYHTAAVISDMAVGGACAWLCLTRARFRDFLVRIPLPAIVATYVVAAGLILLRRSLFSWGWSPAFERLVFSIFFAFVVLEQTYAAHSPFKLHRLRRITNLGRYTYALYCLHFLALYIVLALRRKVPVPETLFQVLVVDTVMGLALSIALAWLSYHLLERRFLELKERFSSFSRSRRGPG